MSSPISKVVLDGMYSRLSNPTTGFNPVLAAAASKYSIPGFSIDFSATSPNFFFGNVSPDVVESLNRIQENSDPSSILAYALLTIDTLRDQDTALVTSASFAGDIQGVISLTLAWASSQVPQTLAYWTNACEETMYNVLSSPSNQASWTVAGLAFDRKVPMMRGAITVAGSNLRQTIQWQPMFRLIAA